MQYTDRQIEYLNHGSIDPFFFLYPDKLSLGFLFKLPGAFCAIF